MSKIDDGGPAFPRSCGMNGGTGNASEVGMSLRDWLAGMVAPQAYTEARKDLAKLLSPIASLKLGDDELKEVMESDEMKMLETKTAENVAAVCYRIADAMIAEKRRTEGAT